jgi:hypothetical protein
LAAPVAAWEKPGLVKPEEIDPYLFRLENGKTRKKPKKSAKREKKKRQKVILNESNSGVGYE